MNRRDFIRQTSLGTAAFGVLAAWPVSGATAADAPRRLTILHTNDMHSRIEPFPDSAGEYAGRGGMARRAALIKQIRAQEPHVLLLDSGDIFQGTPYFNFFGGELEYKLMSQMGYDAGTLGNHDFDNGIEGLQRQLPHANFPFIIANYDFAQTALAGRFQPYKVLERAGLRIGIFGLGIQLKGLVAEKGIAGLQYLDPIPKAREMVTQLRGPEKCDFIICLSHLGHNYTKPGEETKPDDCKLAAQVGGIDLILGGHTHTFLDAPERIAGPDGHHTLINQVGWAGINLGRLDFEFARGSRRPALAQASVLPVSGAC